MPRGRGWAVLLACALSLPVSGFAEQITAERLTSLPPADVVILGEVHDNPVHHLNQAGTVASIDPKALVFEMLTEDQALKIRPELLTDASALEAALDWADSGWPDFAMYYPIFAASDGAPIFGGAAPRGLVRQAVTDGAAPVFGGAAPLFGLDQTLDDREQSARESLQFDAHCGALPVTVLAGMVEAQRYRDAVLARAVLMALAEDGPGPVALITGNGHARTDWGVPAALREADAGLQVLSIGQLESAPEGAAPYDLWLVTEAAERGDPCEAFR